MAEIKITKKMNFMELKNIVAEMGRDDLVAFIDHEIELLANKKSLKPTKTQIENDELRPIILEVLASNDTQMRIGDIQKSHERLVGLSNQKISRLVSDLVKVGKVARTEVKGVAYFSLA